MDDETIRVLTVRQPWADLIVFGSKDVENRVWTPAAHLLKPGETFAIHAAANVHRSDIDRAAALVDDSDRFNDVDRHVIHMWTRGRPNRLGIIFGTAVYAGVTGLGYEHGEWPHSPWEQPDSFHWRLTDRQEAWQQPKAAGRLGLWSHARGRIFPPEVGTDA